MSRAVGVALVLAAVLVAATEARAQTAEPLVGTVPSITVTGVAQRDVPPDLALVTIGVVTDRATAIQAAQDNAQAATTLVAAARTAGVAAPDIQTSELRLSPIADDKDASRIRVYRANNVVTLRLHDLSKIGSLVGQLTSKGANTLEGIDFGVENPQPILDDLQAAATQDALRKAGIYTRAANVKLGRILRITPVSDDAPPMARSFKMQVAAMPASPPVEAGSQHLGAKVEISWELTP